MSTLYILKMYYLSAFIKNRVKMFKKKILTDIYISITVFTYQHICLSHLLDIQSQFKTFVSLQIPPLRRIHIRIYVVSLKKDFFQSKYVEFDDILNYLCVRSLRTCES